MSTQPTSIQGRHATLRPMSESDIPAIFSWRSKTDDLYLWFQRPEILSFEEFTDDFQAFLRNVIHVNMMIQIGPSSTPAGMVYSYRADYLNGHVYLCTYLAHDHRHSFYGAETSLLFIDYLFTYFPFRKIYGEVYDYNSASLNNVIKGGFVEEARLRQHRWYRGQYADMLILALYRDTFYSRFGKLLPLLTKKT